MENKRKKINKKKAYLKKKKRAKTKEVELFSFPRLGRAFSVIMTLHLFRLWVFLLPSKRSILGTFPYSAQFGLTRFPHPILIISADKRSFPEFLLQLSEYHSCKLNSINSKVFVLCVFKSYFWYLFFVLEYLLIVQRQLSIMEFSRDLTIKGALICFINYSSYV